MLSKNIANRIHLPFILFVIFILLPEPIISQFTPGETYYDVTGFVEYRAGNLPIIISAPHGGSLQPDSIPDRSCSGCVYVKDSWTQSIAEGMDTAFNEQTGCYPHVIINLLHRVKFDANRDIGDAADGNPIVEQTWMGYHDFIDSAKEQVIQEYGRGLFLDIHGHAHEIQRIELGYLLNGNELRLSDSNLNTINYIEESSIRRLVGDNIQGLSHAELLRSQESFGTLLNGKGFPSVPSLTVPFPQAGEPYFSGGYNTQRHGSRNNDEEIDAIQLELNQDIRFDAARRAMLIDSLTNAVNQYINLHYDNQYSNNYCGLISNISENHPQYEIAIFPNPASNYINIDSDLDEIEVSIYNLLGKKVQVAVWRGVQIDIGSLKSGYHVVKLRKGELDLGYRRLIKF